MIELQLLHLSLVFPPWYLPCRIWIAYLLLKNDSSLESQYIDNMYISCYASLYITTYNSTQFGFFLCLIIGKETLSSTYVSFLELLCSLADVGFALYAVHTIG